MKPGRGRVGGHRERLEGRVADQRERPLRADDEAAEDLDGLVRVEERAQAVSRRVLDLELMADPLRQFLVGADLVAELGETGGELGLLGLEAGGSVGRRRVDQRAGGRHEGHVRDGLVGVEADATAHPTGVVRDDAADRRDLGRGWVRAELSVVAAQDAVRVAQNGAGPDLHAGGVAIQDLNASPVAADVHQDAGSLPLSVEARPPRTEGDGDAVLAAVCDDARRACGVPRLDYHLRDQAVGARVRGVANEVGGAGEDGAFADQPGEVGAKRLGSALRDPVWCSVGGDGRHEVVPRTATCPARHQPRPALASAMRSRCGERRSTSRRPRRSSS